MLDSTPLSATAHARYKQQNAAGYEHCREPSETITLGSIILAAYSHSSRSFHVIYFKCKGDMLPTHTFAFKSFTFTSYTAAIRRHLFRTYMTRVAGYKFDSPPTNLPQ
jgi:hypothetical protein